MRQVVRSVVAGSVAALLVTGGVVAVAPAAGAAACTAAGPSGLTARVVAHTGQRLEGTLDATGCDIGVYVGPGVTHVVVDHMVIKNAGDHGVLVEDTHDVVVYGSLVTGSKGLHSDTQGGKLSEDKAIALLGTHDVVVAHNHVLHNADGGIAVNDDGPVPSSALNAARTTVPATHNIIVANTVFDSGAGCGIVLSAYNPKTPVADNRVVGNRVVGNSAGIVVAADGPNSVVEDNAVVGNISANNILPGVVVHSNTPGDVVDGTVVVRNLLSGNGKGAAAKPNPETGKVFPAAGVWLSGEVEKVTGSVVAGNHVANELWGVWQNNAPDTTYAGNRYDPGIAEDVHVTP